MHRALYVDLDRCFGCFTCEVACKQEHDLPVGIRWIKVVQDGPKEISGGLQLDFYPAMCKHCENPACAEACPEEAISKGTDGLVLINPDSCNGCRACLEGCPFGLMSWDASTEKASKCTLCTERLDQGLEPSCVAFCPGKALIVTTERLEEPRMLRWV